MIAGDAQGMEGSHGKPGDRAVCAIGKDTVFAFDQGHAVSRQQMVIVAGEEIAGIFVIDVVHAGHDNDHFTAFAVRNEVVKDIVDLPLPDPAGFVLAAAVVQVQHRIAPVRIFTVRCRGIDPDVVHIPGFGGAVDFHVDGAMGHIAIQVILNVAVVTNTIPNTGITLPFISYGGTSVLFLLSEMGLVLAVSRWQSEKKCI